MFYFKQFNVDQTGCAMKINTDGVLLGAMASAEEPKTVLDIGTGTGVIALMLAQKFKSASVDAVELDESAAKTAGVNFQNSAFKDRLEIYASSIKVFFDNHPDRKYNLVVSNPPFYLNSLESPKDKISLAKHTDIDFFENLMRGVSSHLSDSGNCWLIYPFQKQKLINDLVTTNALFLQKRINIHSFAHSEPHRQIACFGKEEMLLEEHQFIIYDAVGVYSALYKEILQPYFLAF